MKLSLKFCFRGLWIGFFFHRHTGALHVCVIPFTQIVIDFRRRYRAATIELRCDATGANRSFDCVSSEFQSLHEFLEGKRGVES